eukprot:TRINITY_DN5893_c0_g2_i2.p1 TRINITY_DN5893_c0_g2~~TRINITY_DN5893_c0_g2_i2.p1  ORF type:complete len:622 (-),score=84.70 TRINITY_DN5893_c0_g2_i2:92-1957(-)
MSSSAELDTNNMSSSAELDCLGTGLVRAVKTAVAEVLAAEIQDLKLDVGKAACMLEKLVSTLERERRSNNRAVRPVRSQPGTSMSDLPRIGRAQSSSSQGAASQGKTGRGAAGLELVTLEMVSDKLFHEILNGSSHNSGDPDLSAVVGPQSEHSSQSSRSSRSRQSCDQQLVLPGTEEAPAPMGSSVEVQEHPATSSSKRALPLPGSVMPSLPDDGQSNNIFDIADLASPNSNGRYRVTTDSTKRSANLVSQRMQSKIIEPYTQQNGLGDYTSFTPVVGCILKSSRRWSCMLLLTAVLFAGMRVALLASGDSIKTFLVRDLAVVVFTIAAGISTRQRPEARTYTESIAQWAQASQCVEDWGSASRRKQRMFLIWWCTAMALVLSTEAVLASQYISSPSLQPTGILEISFWAGYEFASLVALLLSSSLLLAVSCVQCHIISGLNVFIDEWSCDLCDQRDFSQGVLTWNTVQALIRRGGSSIENAFATIQICALAGSIVVAMKMITLASDPALRMESLATLAGITELTTSLPLLMLAALAGLLLLQCAGITEKCAILPPIANQIMTGAIDAGRQYLVQFLNDSAAGIYVKGVKLDMLMVVNIGYFLCVAFSALAGLAMRFSAT